MKKNSFKIFARRTFGAAAIIAVLSVYANAAEVPARYAFHESVATVKYIGTDNDNYVFNVAYNNESSERFTLRITDEEGNTLFTGTYNDKKFDKRFKLSKDNVNGKLNFAIKNLKDNSVQSFQITTTSQVIENVVVKKS